MIYLSEKVLKDEDFFLEGYFVKRKGVWYFVSYEIEKDKKYLCIKLWNKIHDDRFEIEIVNVEISREGDFEKIETEEVITDKRQRKDALIDFFYRLSFEDNPQSVIMYEPILELIEEYIEDGYFYTDSVDSVFENTLCGDFLELFTLTGTVIEDYYEGNLVLRNISLKNESTGQVIKNFNNVNMTSRFYVEEEDDADYMIEGYLECLSEYDIKEKFMEAIRQEK